MKLRDIIRNLLAMNSYTPHKAEALSHETLKRDLEEQRLQRDLKRQIEALEPKYRRMLEELEGKL